MTTAANRPIAAQIGTRAARDGDGHAAVSHSCGRTVQRSSCQWMTPCESSLCFKKFTGINLRLSMADLAREIALVCGERGRRSTGTGPGTGLLRTNSPTVPTVPHLG